jgi:hypothetical protein
MSIQGTARDAMVRGAWLTVAWLFGGLAAGIGVGNLTFRLLPGSDTLTFTPAQAGIAAVPFFLAMVAGSAAWGVSMGQLAGSADRRRMAYAGMLAFPPITLVTAFTLLGLEGFAVTRIGTLIPIHRLFTLLFVPAAFLIAGVAAWAIGRGLRDPVLARSLFWRVGLSAAAAFLVVNLAMQWLGWVVGGPGAAARATMLVTMFTGDLAAAIAGGAALGRALAARRA